MNSVEKKRDFQKLLIDHVKSNPILWDPKAKGYEDVKQAAALWNEIDKELKLKSGSARNLFNVLKSSFRIHYQKECEKGDSYRCPWPYYISMDFLRTTIANADSSSEAEIAAPTDSEPSMHNEALSRNEPSRGPIRLLRKSTSYRSADPFFIIPQPQIKSPPRKRCRHPPPSDDNRNNDADDCDNDDASDSETATEAFLEAYVHLENLRFLEFIAPKLDQIPKEQLNKCHVDILNVLNSYT